MCGVTRDCVRGAGYRPHKRLRGHMAGVESIDWSADGSCLQSSDSSHEVLYWDALTGTQLLDTATVETDTAWASWSSKVGFPVMGVWPAKQGSDANFLNAVDVSTDRGLVATVDNDGGLRVLHSPCVVASAPAVEQRAHGDRALGVAFLARAALDDNAATIVTVGGRDRTLLVWRVGGSGTGGIAKTTRRPIELKKTDDLQSRLVRRA